jgi:hypothetical protein
MIGAVVPKIVSSYQTYVNEGKPLPSIHWYEPLFLIGFMLVAGVVSVVLEAQKRFQAFYIGFSLPIIITTYFPGMKPQDVLQQNGAPPPGISAPAVPGAKKVPDLKK